MSTPSDQSYIETKKIKQGKIEMNADFKFLVDWMDKTYGVRPLNIRYDLIDRGQRPRLEIYLEYDKEKEKFEKGKYRMYDPAKQKEIAQQFQKMVKKHQLPYKMERLWVIF